MTEQSERMSAFLQFSPTAFPGFKPGEEFERSVNLFCSVGQNSILATLYVDENGIVNSSRVTHDDTGAMRPFLKEFDGRECLACVREFVDEFCENRMDVVNVIALVGWNDQVYSVKIYDRGTEPYRQLIVAAHEKTSHTVKDTPCPTTLGR